MPRTKRPRREPTHDWQHIQQWTLWPEQKTYELLRPVVLFNEPASERAKETGANERTLQYKSAQFEERGMASLFPKEPAPAADHSHSLPPDIRQSIVISRRSTLPFIPMRLRRFASYALGASLVRTP